MNKPSPADTPSSCADAPPPLLQQRSGGVLRLTLNRPAQFNALSEDLLAALQAALDGAAADPGVRVVILAAAGRAFCAGHDLRQMQENPRLDYYQWLFAECARIMRRMRTLPQPVIARVQGLATAGGCQLVASCDLAVASDAARFAASGINIGLFCATPAVPLSRNMGQKQAFEMLFTGDFIDAETARERGLVNRVVAADALDAHVDTLAAAIVDKPADIVAAGKALFYRQQEMGTDAAYQLAVQAMAANVMDPQAREGISAFLEKRSPSWHAALQSLPRGSDPQAGEGP